MIIKDILDYIGDELTEPCYCEEPDAPPASYVLLDQKGQSKTEHIKYTRLAFNSIAPSMYEAAELAEKVIVAVESAIELDNICKIELNSNYNFTDTSSKRYRYQTLFDITHY